MPPSLLGGVSLGGPCLSEASWSALLDPASVPSEVAGWGVNGFGFFCRNKRTSAGGPKPAIENDQNQTHILRD